MTNGARYEGDLTKQITHLVSFRTEGAKYKAARSWGIRVVAPEWLWDSLERGMILDEELYDPVVPIGERGKGAWDKTKELRQTLLGKRPRESSGIGDEGRRKMRRTASARITNQSQQMLGDIIGAAPAVQNAKTGEWDEVDNGQRHKTNTAVPRRDFEACSARCLGPSSPSTHGGVFQGCRFYLHGFDSRKRSVLHGHVVSNGGDTSEALDNMHLCNENHHTFLVVPSEMPLSEHPDLSDNTAPMQIVTEWWIERCLHHKQFSEPSEHVIGRPIPHFPLQSFRGMTISSAAFLGIDRLHVGKVTKLLGAIYSEDFTPQVTVLVTKSAVGLRKDKLHHAQEWNVPIVRSEWLWDSIAAGTKLPFDAYRLRGLRRAESGPASKEGDQDSAHDQRSRSNSAKPPSKVISESSPKRGELAPTAPKLDDAFAPEEPTIKEESTIEDTAFADLDIVAPRRSQPLQEISSNSPSKPASTSNSNLATSSKQHLIPQDQEELDNALTNLIAANKNTKSTSSANEAAEGTNASAPPRKRRENRIKGRIPSNLSTGSCSLSRATSVDSTATHGNPVEWGNSAPSKQVPTPEVPKKKTSSAAATSIEEFMKEDKRRVVDEDSQPPATQVSYVDPESEEQRERVMAKMRGERVERTRGRGKEKERSLTIGGGVGIGIVEKMGRGRGRPPKAGFR